MAARYEIRPKRVYDEPEKEDGFRILVDRLWPRGLSKKEARIDLWMKDIAPSNDLRKWFAHGLSNWSKFRERYIEELEQKQDLLEAIVELARKHRKITLLYGASD
jgi:uncharacterized protein YeaO (DUF488 family)